MKKGWPWIITTLAALVFAGQAAIAATGEARLGYDPRSPENGQIISNNFGFAFMDYVEKGSPQLDSCTTVDKHYNHTLTAIDGVASPENEEAIIYWLNGDTVTFFGRTGECYYMVTGTPGSGSGGGGLSPGKWNADFDTNSDEYDTPHFVVYINERYRSDDDTFVVGGPSAVWIELHNDLNWTSQRHFKLFQEPLSDDGAVTFLNPDGTPADPNQVYSITADASICVYATGSVEGVVVITAYETDYNGAPPTETPVSIPATTSAPVQATLAIVPDAGQAGTTGNVVGSTKGATGEKHYVSPGKASGFVILKATGYSGAFDDYYKWDPVPTAGTDVQPVTGSPEKVKVKRDAPKKIVVKVLDKGAPNTKRDQMNVWIVWASCLTAQRLKAIWFDRGGEITDRQNPAGKGPGVIVESSWSFTFKVEPTDLVKGNGDRPDFSGVNVNPVPGAERVHVGTGDKLRGGAKSKWDLSRRIRIKVLSPVATKWFSGQYPQATIFDNLPAACQVQEDYPTDDDCIGNDDTSTGDEIYTSLSVDAQMTSIDSPRMPALRDAGGNVGDTVEFRIQFGEFVRLEIAGKWYRVSQFYDWRHHAKLKKASEAADNVDYNNDGNKNAELWIDNGSVSDYNTNAGWE